MAPDNNQLALVGNPATRRLKALGSEALRHHLSMALPNKSLVRTRLLSQATRWAAPTAQGRTVRNLVTLLLDRTREAGIPMSYYRHGTQLFQIASVARKLPHITSLVCRPG